MGGKKSVSKQDIQDFWELHPLAAAVIPFEPGTQEFFDEHTRLRAAETDIETTRWAYELEEASGKRVLDVGCGNGFVSLRFAEAGARLDAIDITGKAVELTKTRLALSGFTANVMQADAESLPFEDETFDIVVSFGVLHHTPDTEQAITEIDRVLKPGGRLLLMLYHRNSFVYRALFPAKRVIQPRWRGKSSADQINAVDGSSNPLGKVYSKSEVRMLLSTFAGVEFMASTMFFRWERFLPGPLKRIIERHWGWHLFIKADKVSMVSPSDSAS